MRQTKLSAFAAWGARMKRLFFVALCTALSACAGRTGHPVATTESYDGSLSCEQLKAEIAGNETKAQKLYAENSSAHDSNIAIGVVGAVLFWPALFAIDTGTAEKDEMHALHDRNAHLQSLVDSKCTTPAPTSAASAVEGPRPCKLLNGRVISRTEGFCKQIGGTL